MTQEKGGNKWEKWIIRKGKKKTKEREERDGASVLGFWFIRFKNSKDNCLLEQREKRLKKGF